MRVRIVLLVSMLVGGLACPAKEKPASDTVATPAPVLEARAPEKKPSPATVDEGACSAVPSANTAAVNATRTLLSGLDEIRAAAFQPSFALPQTPKALPEAACGTKFATAPVKDAYKRELEAYQAAVKKVERELDRYTADFHREWARVDLSPNAKPSKLMEAAAGKGAVARDATCLVQEVEGRCRRACRFDRGDGVIREDARACSAEYDLGRWMVNCSADFICAVDPPLASNRTGLSYTAGSFRMRYAKSFKAKDEADAAQVFQDRIGAVGYGQIVTFPSVGSWTFAKGGWIGEAIVEDGWPTVAAENAACCTQREAVAQRRRQALADDEGSKEDSETTPEAVQP